MSPVALISMNVAPVGGIGADLLKCIRALCAQGRQVHVLYGFLDPDTHDYLPGCQVRWHRIFMPKRPPVLAQATLFVSALIIIRKLRSSYPDMRVFCFERLPLGDMAVGCPPNALWLAARRRMGMSVYSQIPYRWWNRWMDHRLHRSYQGKLVVYSERDRQALIERGADSARVERVIIPTDTGRFRPESAGERPYVSIIGANMRLKGLDLVLRIWPIVLQQHPDLRLRVITHGRKVQQAVEAAGLPNVEISGFIPQVEIYYHASRLLLVPSMFESWGNVVPEALACGVPVVASSDVPASELLSDPSMGVVFERDGKHDMERLEEAMNRALKLDIEPKAQQLRHHVVKEFMAGRKDLVSYIQGYAA